MRRKGGSGTTVIYLDTLFLLNGAVDYLLLLAAARLAGERLCRGRFLLGAILGGCYAVALFVPGFTFLSLPLCRMAAAALMIVTAYGQSRHLLRQTMIFLAITCAFGGGVLAIDLMGGQGSLTGERGVLQSPLDLKTILLSASLCYVVITVVLKRVGRHGAFSEELRRVSIWLEGRNVALVALTDTGNTLDDPISGQSVMVAEGASLEELFPGEYRPTQADLQDPAGVGRRLWDGAWKSRFRLLPYRAVGIERGLLLAVRVDRMELDGVDYGARLVALSPTPVSDGGHYRALVGRMG